MQSPDTMPQAKPSPKHMSPVPYERHGINDLGYELFAFRGDDLRKFLGPGVYTVVRKQGDDWEYLYIGSAKNVLARISDEAHESLRKALAFEGAILFVAVCKSEAHARATEADLIAFLQPILNIAGKSPNGSTAKALAETQNVG